MNTVDPQIHKTAISPSDLIAVITNASQSFRHAEVIVQSRLYNFLVGASILFLSWATIFIGTILPARQLVLVCLAALGAVLSALWIVLGWRQGKFIELHMDIICYLERKLDDKDLAITTPISDLQLGKKIDFRTREGSVYLGKAERVLKSRNLLWLAPMAFMAAFLFLLWLSTWS